MRVICKLCYKPAITTLLKHYQMRHIDEYNRLKRNWKEYSNARELLRR